jgi:hypothetical protein
MIDRGIKKNTHWDPYRDVKNIGIGLKATNPFHQGTRGHAGNGCSWPPGVMWPKAAVAESAEAWLKGMGRRRFTDHGI